MTSYRDVINQLEEIKVNSEQYYGDFGFDLDIQWEGDVIKNISVSWPNMRESYIDDAYRFAEALAAVCYDSNQLIGKAVTD